MKSKKDGQWRHLSKKERRILTQNGNRSDDWDDVLVGENFAPNSICNSTFSGTCKLGGKTEEYLEYDHLSLPIGIYNSTICSCDIGKDTGLHNVKYLSRFDIGERVLLFNIDEMGRKAG